MAHLRRPFRLALASVACCLLAGALPAAAGEVTVTSDFFGYQGPAWYKDYVFEWGTTEVRTKIEVDGAVQDLIPIEPFWDDTYGLYTDAGMGVAAQPLLRTYP